jgi:hypothetical protein
VRGSTWSVITCIYAHGFGSIRAYNCLTRVGCARAALRNLESASTGAVDAFDAIEEKPMMILRNSALLALAGLLVAGAAAPAFAETAWDRHHPRRDQVNDRIANQEHRITQERREGEISRGQARAIREQLRGVRAEERADARLHGSHITRVEQAQLNRDLNATGREIGR